MCFRSSIVICSVFRRRTSSGDAALLRGVTMTSFCSSAGFEGCVSLSFGWVQLNSVLENSCFTRKYFIWFEPVTVNNSPLASPVPGLPTSIMLNPSLPLSAKGNRVSDYLLATSTRVLRVAGFTLPSGSARFNWPPQDGGAFLAARMKVTDGAGREMAGRWG